MVRVSGFGQTGPYAERAGYGSVGEAMGGIRYLAGDPDRPPVRVGLSIGDSLAATFACVGALAALHHRANTGVGQVVDSAIYEAVLAMMESTVPEYTAGGFIRERSGAILPKTAPSNVYPTRTGEMIVMGANQDSVFSRLCDAMQRPELARDARFVDHVARGENQAELDELISRWSATLDAEPLLQRLNDFGVPAGRIYRAPEMLADPHFAARAFDRRRAAPAVREPEDAGRVSAHVRHARQRALAGSGARRAQRRGLRRTARPRSGDASGARARRRHLTMVSLDDIREAHDRIRPVCPVHPGFHLPRHRRVVGRPGRVQVREFCSAADHSRSAAL